MNTTKETWPGTKPPTKEELERLYRLAYMIDAQYFKREDVVDLGLDLHRLKEFGEVKMSKGLTVLRKHAGALWKRLNDAQRTAYIIADVFSKLQYIDQAVQELAKEVGPLPEVADGIGLVRTGLFSRVPAHLRERLAKGLGKWKNGV